MGRERERCGGAGCRWVVGGRRSAVGDWLVALARCCLSLPTSADRCLPSCCALRRSCPHPQAQQGAGQRRKRDIQAHRPRAHRRGDGSEPRGRDCRAARGAGQAGAGEEGGAGGGQGRALLGAGCWVLGAGCWVASLPAAALCAHAAHLHARLLPAPPRQAIRGLEREKERFAAEAAGVAARHRAAQEEVAARDAAIAELNRKIAGAAPCPAAPLLRPCCSCVACLLAPAAVAAERWLLHGSRCRASFTAHPPPCRFPPLTRWGQRARRGCASSRSCTSRSAPSATPTAAAWWRRRRGAWQGRLDGGRTSAAAASAASGCCR